LSVPKADIPFINTAIFAINTIIKSTEYVHDFNTKWFGMRSPHVVIVNNNTLRNENKYGRDILSAQSRGNPYEKYRSHNQESGDFSEYFVAEKSNHATSVAEFCLTDDECGQESAIILDRCWTLADQLTSVNPVKSKLNVRTNLIDFNFEIENGKVSICIDGNDQTGETEEITSTKNDEEDINDSCIESRLIAVKEELDGLNEDDTVLDNYLEDVKKHNSRNKTLSFGLDDETCVYYKSCSETSDTSELDEYDNQEEDEEECENERKSRLDFLKEQLMSTLQAPKREESCKGDVVEICAKIEEEISLSRRAMSVVSEYSENAEEPTGYVPCYGYTFS